MCDLDTEADNQAFFNQPGQINRRRFVAGIMGASLALYLPLSAHAQSVSESYVSIATPDGEADAYFVHPISGRHPAVLIWPDILGLRAAFELMGKRLAQEGYTVLVINPFYRVQKAPVVAEGASFADEATRNAVFKLAKTLSPQTHVTDAQAFIGWLDKQSQVDTQRKMATTGYCMGGPMVMRTAATRPDRIGVAATFHGGGLATQAEDSPHLLIPKMRAQFLIAIAENDDQRDPAAKTLLREAFAAARLKAEIEVYPGTLHGWCPLDSRVYNPEQAERAWSRLLATFKSGLA